MSQIPIKILRFGMFKDGKMRVKVIKKYVVKFANKSVFTKQAVCPSYKIVLSMFKEGQMRVELLLNEY